jgi:hypothetical protein
MAGRRHAGRRRAAGPISLDPSTGHLHRGDRTVLLRPKDLAALLHLVAHFARPPWSERVAQEGAHPGPARGIALEPRRLLER